MRIAIRRIGLVSAVILARLPVRADFGLVAMATPIYGPIEIMGEFGFEVVLIQKQDAGRDYYDTAWTLSILRGVIIDALGFAPMVPAAEIAQHARHADQKIPISAGLATVPISWWRQYISPWRRISARRKAPSPGINRFRTSSKPNQPV